MKLSRIIKRFRIDHPHKFRLADIDPGDTCGLDIDKAEAKAIIAKSIQQLARRQDVRIGCAAMIVDVDAVGAFDASGHGQLVRRKYTHTNNDHVGRMFGAILGEHRAHAT